SEGEARFRQRWDTLMSVDLAYRSGSSPLGKAAEDFAGFYQQAKLLTESPDIVSLFTVSDDEVRPYGATTFGSACVAAEKVLAARRGARVIQLSQDGWAHHAKIYDSAVGLPSLCATLDPAVSRLIADLQATPGEDSGKTLLDETLILMAGEFGRTTGALTGQAGRDHFLRYTTLLAGGGVRGGRAMGKT